MGGAVNDPDTATTLGLGLHKTGRASKNIRPLNDTKHFDNNRPLTTTKGFTTISHFTKKYYTF